MFVCFLSLSAPSIASPWLSKIGQVKRDSGASLIQFDRTAGYSEFDLLISREQGRNRAPHPVKVLHHVFCFAMQEHLVRWKVGFVVEVGTTRHGSSSRQRAARLVCRTPAFFSGWAAVEIWALWTCLLVENRFLCTPVKLPLLETWLTGADSASVLVNFRSRLHCVSPLDCRVVYVNVSAPGKYKLLNPLPRL